MEIAVRTFQDKHILDISGELDLYHAHLLRETILRLVQQDVRAFVLNLKAVRYIDSSGVAALLSINALLSGKARKLRIANISRPVARIIDLTRLAGFLPISGSELEALESIGRA